MASINDIPKTFEPSAIEGPIYEKWLKDGRFHADAASDKDPYTIVIPPPNITGQLHMGHALDNALQDLLIRFKRMQGFEALWLPGTDHASIATEAKIVEAMAAEGLTKDDVGREGFLERAWAWREEYGGRIIRQLKRLGSSCGLGPRAVHHGRRPFGGGPGSVCPVVRKGTDLPRRADHQLVPALPDVHLRSGSGL